MHQGPEGAALVSRQIVKPTPVIAIVGPTASGKTAAALALARRLGGEVLSADMGQLYRGLDAGTAKPPGTWAAAPSGERRTAGACAGGGPLAAGVYRVAGIAYHLVDLLDPSEETDAARYAALARPLLAAVRAAGRVPIVAGGTGLYIRALLDGLDPLPPRDATLRARLSERAEREGAQALHRELAARDPDSGRRIPPRNLPRVIRALEVLELTGRPIAAAWTRGKEEPAEPAVYLGPLWETAELDARIRERAEAMFPAMIREAAALVPARFTGREPGFRCLGYPEALACARGELAQDEGLARTIRATRAYAKRQRTWFRRQAPVRWIPAGALARDPDGWAARALEAIRWSG